MNEHLHLTKRLLVALACAAAFAALGAGRAAAAGFDQPTVAITASSPTAAVGASIRFTATVTATSGFPAGIVLFSVVDPAANTTGQPLNPGGATVQSTGTLNQGIATYDASFAQGAYSVVASYQPSDPLAFVGASSAVPVVVTVTGTPPITTHTSLTASPAVLVPGQPETFTATVTSGAGTPTGPVDFLDNGVKFDSETLNASGVAVASHQGGFGPGLHTITAAYLGNAFDRTNPTDPVFNPSQATVTLDGGTADTGTVTHTTVTVSRSPVNQGDTVSVTAHVTQDGGALLPVGNNEVDFTVNGVTQAIGSAQVDAQGNAVLQNVGGWSVGIVTVTASYIGNRFLDLNPSVGTVSLDVRPPGTASTLTLSGPGTSTFGHSATFTAHLAGTSGALVGKTITFTLGSQSCTGTTDASGNASCAFPVSDPTTMSIAASFAGDVGDTAATATNRFAVTPAPTSLTVTTVGPTHLVATLLTEGVPLAGQSVHLTLGSHACDATTSSAGVAACDIAPVGTPTATLAASFAGNASYAASTASIAPYTIPTIVATTITYTGPASAAFGATVTLSARLVDANNNALVGRTVHLALGTQSCDGTTSSTGAASCTLTLTQAVGSTTANASYAGDATTAASSASASFTITRAPTTTVATLPTPGATTTTLVATLTNSSAPLSGKTMSLSLGANACTATTNASGVATCTVTNPSGSSATYTASFAGDAGYAGSSDTKTVPLLAPSAITFLGVFAADYHDPALLSVFLRSADNKHLLANERVTITVGTQSCVATTNFLGLAACWISITQAPGSYVVTSTFAGDAAYAGSTDTDSFQVTREETSIDVLTPQYVAASRTVALSAKLLEDNQTPIAGRTLTLSLGSHSCTGTTNASGIATCTVAMTTYGSMARTASFAGDAYYEASSDHEDCLVYGYLSDGGTFVVGDDHWNGTVHFWGSQWSKDNHPSHGSASSSFNGYAHNSGDRTCGSSWSTDAGSSAAPPQDLPAYMAVIVAGSTKKSGAAISGDVEHLVIVKTGTGFDGSPAHDGYGTVVATIF
jgi:hypothetical protein